LLIVGGGHGGVMLPRVTLADLEEPMGLTRTIIPSVFLSALVAVFVTAASGSALAQTQRLRGEIETMSGNTITVKTPEGQNVKVMLDPNYTVNHAVKIKLTDIKPGTYVGIGSMPEGDELKAMQVQVFPPDTRAREMHGAWSADPSAMMTNAKTTMVVAGQKDDKITLTTHGQNYTITVPPEAPVVRTEAGSKDLVKPGAWVGISNAVEQNGVLTTKAIIVSDDRRYPAR
jgi:hypothetical protein